MRNLFLRTPLQARLLFPFLSLRSFQGPGFHRQGHNWDQAIYEKTISMLVVLTKTSTLGKKRKAMKWRVKQI
jgi:hypothetical protein